MVPRHGATSWCHVATSRCHVTDTVVSLVELKHETRGKECREVLNRHAEKACPPFCFDCTGGKEALAVPSVNAVDGEGAWPMPPSFVYIVKVSHYHVMMTS